MYSTGQTTILVVEDDRMNRTILARFLSLQGFRVLSASDGAVGMELAQAERPDLILMDMAMPVLDGWSAVRQIRGDPALQRTPIIALTAYAMKEERERCLAVGCDDYSSKPIDFPQLLQKIRALLDRDGGG